MDRVAEVLGGGLAVHWSGLHDLVPAWTIIKQEYPKAPMSLKRPFTYLKVDLDPAPRFSRPSARSRCHRETQHPLDLHRRTQAKGRQLALALGINNHLGYSGLVEGSGV